MGIFQIEKHKVRTFPIFSLSYFPSIQTEIAIHGAKEQLKKMRKISGIVIQATKYSTLTEESGAFNEECRNFPEKIKRDEAFGETPGAI